MIRRITAWSLSRLQMYEQCPWKAARETIDKVKAPKIKEATEGIDLHKNMELFTKGTAELDPELEKLRSYLEYYRQLVAQGRAWPELQIAFDQNWRQVAWFAKNAYARVVVDLLVAVNRFTAGAVDYKTGKFKLAEGYEQGRLYALALFKLKPALTEVRSKYLYSKGWKTRDPESDQVVTNYAKDFGKHVKDEEQSIQIHFEERADRMLTDTIFEPHKGPLCDWCWHKTNGCPAHIGEDNGTDVPGEGSSDVPGN